jgi:hypothetical protein
LIEAPLCDPDNVIGFATDGVFNQKTLNVPVPARKQLGQWELKVAKDGGSFMEAGIRGVHEDNELGEKGLKIGSRGLNPQNTARDRGVSPKKALDMELYENIPQFWRNGKPCLSVSLSAIHDVFGLRRHSPFVPLIGCWKMGPREL